MNYTPIMPFIILYIYYKLQELIIYFFENIGKSKNKVSKALQISLAKIINFFYNYI